MQLYRQAALEKITIVKFKVRYCNLNKCNCIASLKYFDIAISNNIY